MTTDANGYVTHSDWDEQKVVGAFVFKPARCGIDLWLNNISDSTYYADIYTRGSSHSPIANQEVKIKVWFKDY